MAQHLSKNVVRDAQPPEGSGHRFIWDDEIKGFALRVTRSGAKSYVLCYHRGGRERRFTIGSTKEWTATAAREEAKRLRRVVRDGGDPLEDRRRADAEAKAAYTAPTVRDLADRYASEHLPQKRDQARDREMISKNIIPHIGGRLVAEVHQNDIRALHKRLTEKHGPVRANRVLALLSKMFSLSLQPRAGESEPWRTPLQGNPCRGVERNPEEGRERYYSTEEIERIIGALSDLNGRPAANLLRFVMLTGCRPIEARQAKWSEIDLGAGTWSKPSAHTKQRKRHVVPLAPPAIELVKQMCQHAEPDCSYLFPGRRLPSGEWKPLDNYRKLWGEICKRAKLAPDADGNAPRVYDLRHSFATFGLGRGLSLELIGKLLGHTRHTTTLKYAHADEGPLREAVASIAEAYQTERDDEGADVVDIATRR